MNLLRVTTHRSSWARLGIRVLSVASTGSESRLHPSVTAVFDSSPDRDKTKPGISDNILVAQMTPRHPIPFEMP